MKLRSSAVARLAMGMGFAAAGVTSALGAGDNDAQWVGTWACSQMLPAPADRPPAPGLDGATLRQFVRASIGGDRVRLRLSNAFGSGPVEIASARLALAGPDATVRGGAEIPLTFGGAASVTLPSGAPMVSDPAAFALPPLADLVITLEVKHAPKEVSGHPGSRTTSYVLPAGAKMDHWYLIDGLDVRQSGSRGGAIAILGDSITDGRGSTTNGNDRWPDQLARRLHANAATGDVGILNQGIGGNRLLRDGLGPNALARLDRDVIAQTGVRWLIVFEGVNDIGSAATARARGEPAAKASDLILAYEQCIRRAHAHGIQVYGATITPFEGTQAYHAAPSEADRQAVNAWIREEGHFDGLIDFDAAVRNPEHPAALAPQYDTGDHLHLNPSGYLRMAEAVDLKLFQ